MCTKRFPAAGFLFTLIAGSLLHFVYGWSGESPFAAPFAPVNESTWEHLKLLFFPVLLFSAAEYPLRGYRCCAFWPSRLAGILAGMAAVTGLFYIYTGIWGKDVFWIDLLLFVLGCFLCFYVSCRLVNASLDGQDPPEAPLLCRRGFCAVSLLFLFLLLVLFTVFTFTPPGIPLFQDPVTGAWGLPA